MDEPEHLDQPEGMTSPPEDTSHSLGARVINVIEIVVVALAGPILAPVLFTFAGVPPERILSSVHFVVSLMLTEASITLPIIYILVRLRGQKLRSIGWWRGSFGREAAIGLAFLPILFASTILISQFFQHVFPQYATLKNPLLDLVQSPGQLLLMILSSLYVGGLKEETQRAFVLTRFDENLGGAVAGLVLWSLFFGYGHLIQGFDNAIAAGALGLIFGLLFIWRRSITGPMIAHAAYDVVTLIVYWEFVAALS
ncbi:MAG: type II CAAX endopeptidase family protein [Acidobacteriota bacterium]